ncbi:HpcH/HpaI aldolase/citrate lyase family protein [Actinophytocola gossypii]|uniref:CoA ester lyase n=1 Tax=Actinophytocola gossypii TaxID=2812003 RepID=A0ABT2JHR7_9PSEU|nr:CoA ester lyase [Actinophytocola gossypii]MCT2587430.1 CoA ester lyase [Actinophytocola gossypii]
MRPRRSALYLPGANERALEKAKTLPADALILDLEDAVAPDAKPAARDRVRTAVTSGDYGAHEVTIRVNAAGTPWHADDLRAVAEARPAAVVVPKVGSPAEVHAIEDALPEPIAIWAMIETPAAVLRCAEIAAASDRLTVLVLGTNDLVNELRAGQVPGRAPLLGALSTCVLAARATGKAILDGVYNDVRDPDGFADECRQGRAFGFDGKTLIHPGQLAPCNEIFAPSAEDVAHANRVIEAFDTAMSEGRGVATVDGRMIENLHVDNARRVLALAAAVSNASPNPS